VTSEHREDLAASNLVVDAVYKGGRAGNAGDDPLGPLLGVSNQGGFRHLGRKERPKLLVITTSMNEPDWPDFLDVETGLFTYYGDNRMPGLDLHETPRWGNRMLRDLFALAQGGRKERESVAPVLVFRNIGTYRDVRFIGLAVPGAGGIPSTQNLVAVWRHASGERFQNYRSIFTILNVPALPRAWLNDIRAGKPHTENAPAVWSAWIRSGQPVALRSEPIITHRTKDEQLPSEAGDERMLSAIHAHFSSTPHGFEACAAELAEMLLPDITAIDVTRPSRDGGRDAVGKFRIGSVGMAIEVEFALEAKCYAPTHSVGVKETSRLISRLRHRQFGLLVTTSYVNAQAYGEIREDQHPVLIVSGDDIVKILKRAGMRDSTAVEAWLAVRFPT
jgi:Restriction endonuclease AspBHI N-terminal/Restriction endonuclease